MNNEHIYRNYYSETAYTAVQESGLAYRIKKAAHDSYIVVNKFIVSKAKRAGNRHFNNRLLDRRIPKVYREAAKAPVDENKIVFVEIRHPRVTNSFEVIFDELVNNYDYTVHTHFLLNSNTVRTDYQKRVINAVEDIATAKYVFLNEGSNAISAIPLRPETKVIQLWHGCGAFKKFGFSTADLIFGANRKEQLRHPFNKNYSLVTVSSPEVVWAYKEAMNLPEDSNIVQPTGSSRTDVFYNEDFISAAYENVYHQVPQAKGKKVILYAPTFRGRVARAKTPDMLNIKMFYENFGDEYVLLFKHHPVVRKRPEIPKEYSEFAMDVTDTLSIEDLLCVSDICISDYSSLVFEYSLFEKPLIFFAYDLDEYFDWRGFYYDYFELAPGLIAKTNFDMIDYIKNIDERFDKEAIKEFRYKFMRSCDGKATQRILEYAFENLEEHRKENGRFEHFYTVPKVESSTLPYFKKVNAIAELKEYAEPLYVKLSEKPINEGSIVAFDIHSPEIRHLLNKQKCETLEFINGDEDLNTVVNSIAVAEYVIIDEPNTFLDSLDIRKETKVVLLPQNAFPLQSVGKVTREFRSGLKKEQYALAPLYKSVSAVVCPSDAAAKLYKPAIGENKEYIVTGDVKSDIFLDRRYKVKLLDAFYSRHPELEGRYVVTYFGAHRETDTLDESLLYEYLNKNFVILKYYSSFDIVEDTANVNEVNYYADSIIDISEEMTVYEALIISDIVVGGFSSSIYSFMVSGKPVIIYSANIKNDIPNTESFLDLNECRPCAVCEDSEQLIDAIRGFKSYDYTKYNELKEKYLTLCDGKSAKRLLEKLK
ncbi:MAG: CDP-glycerol glycerophosphotransferase family protein [Eubacterium sp.]|nr:CDP-glycerol glycerophosphotransferase family protein [Eubacterium sp.]